MLDASAALALLLRVEPAAGRLTRRLSERTPTVHAPYLLDLEVAQALRRYARRGDLRSERGAEAFGTLASLRIERYPHQPFFDRIWRLRHNLTAYDAAYVALAEALDAPLVTMDGKLASAAAVTCAVEVLV